MARSFERIDDELGAFITGQKVFFVASAPLAEDGHVNLSPKGMAGTLTVLDAGTVAYLDLTGSGVETAAHVQENGRITLMWCAFEGRPRIVRIHGRGEVVWPADDRFAELRGRFPDLPGVRSVIVVSAERVSDSCGYAVPLLAYKGERRALVDWSVKKGEDGIVAYWADKNAASLDGLAGVPQDEVGAVNAYLYFLHPIRATFTHDITPDEAMVMQAHFGYLKDLLVAGVLVLGGPCTDGGAIAVAVLEAKNDAAAQAIVENDPAVKQGLGRPELHPFRLSLLRTT